MKVKDPYQSCGPMDKAGMKHLGHFAKSENMNRGHNWDARGFLGMEPKKSLFQQEMDKAAARDAQPKQEPAPTQKPAEATDTTKRRKSLDSQIEKAGG